MAKGVTFPRIGGIIGQAEWRSYVGLIETWDVLKCAAKNKAMKNLIRLIETWDVLKSIPCNVIKHRNYLINRNMRCIEIPL